MQEFHEDYINTVDELRNENPEVMAEIDAKVRAEVFGGEEAPTSVEVEEKED
jgi:hypothetical protein